MNTQQNGLQNGQVVETPSDYNKIQGLLTGMKWDSNNRSALFFFSQDRSTGQGENKKVKWVNFTARLWDRDALFLESIHLFKEQNKALLQTNPQTEKFVALINLSVRNTSYEKPNGKTHGTNNDQASTDTVMLYEGKDSILIDPKTKTVTHQARFHQTHEEVIAAQNQKQA